MKIIKEDLVLDVDKEALINQALERYGDYWMPRKKNLNLLVNQLIGELTTIENFTSKLPATKEEAQKFKAIWCISGAGSLKVPILGTSGDIIFKEKKWGQWTDRDRLIYSLEIIKKISLINSGNKLTKEYSKNELTLIIKKYGPYLIYNGINEQISALLYSIDKKEIIFPKEKLFLPKGNIKKTIDQVKNFCIPDQIINKKGEIGIVSHAPHLIRVLYMLGRYPTVPENLTIKLFPVLLSQPKFESEYSFGELLGIIGYISKGEANLEPCPYEL